VQEFLRGVALAEFLQFFEELICFVASLSQKLGEVVAIRRASSIVSTLALSACAFVSVARARKPATRLS
jgi:hypothetical protein